MKYQRSFMFALLAAAAIAAAVAPAFAHHSFAMFDITTQKTVTGTVSKIDWTNPHIWLWIDVPNDKGGSDTYGFEGRKKRRYVHDRESQRQGAVNDGRKRRSIAGVRTEINRAVITNSMWEIYA